MSRERSWEVSEGLNFNFAVEGANVSTEFKKVSFKMEKKSFPVRKTKQKFAFGFLCRLPLKK